MSTATLMQQLIEIERSIGVKDSTTIRGMLIDAQDSVLWLQRELVEHFTTKPVHGPERLFL